MGRGRNSRADPRTRLAAPQGGNTDDTSWERQYNVNLQRYGSLKVPFPFRSYKFHVFFRLKDLFSMYLLRGRLISGRRHFWGGSEQCLFPAIMCVSLCCSASREFVHCPRGSCYARENKPCLPMLHFCILSAACYFFLPSFLSSFIRLHATPHPSFLACLPPCLHLSLHLPYLSTRNCLSLSFRPLICRVFLSCDSAKKKKYTGKCISTTCGYEFLHEFSALLASRYGIAHLHQHCFQQDTCDASDLFPAV